MRKLHIEKNRDYKRLIDTEWIELRQQVLKYIKRRILSIEGPPKGDFRQYQNNFESEFLGRWKASSKAQLLKAVQQAHIVFGGEFHAHAQSQRTHLRILRSLDPSVPVTLCMECFESKDQLYLDKYIAGKISESVFLSKIKWERRWGFDWSSYKPLLELAKQRQYTVLAINKHTSRRSSKTLFERDLHSAKVITRHLATSRHDLHYVIFGEMHLARKHLPKIIKRQMPKLKTVIIHQNADTLYFQQTSRKEKPQDVLRKGGHVFCVMNTPPWIKWQSYLNYLEFQQAQVEGDSEQEELVENLLRMQCAELKIHIRTDELRIVGADSVALPGPYRRLALQKWDPALYFPEGRLLMTTTTSMNHLASAVGQYIASELSDNTSSFLNLPKDFVPRVWLETLGFFASKLVNPSRQPEALEDLTSSLLEKNVQENMDILKICLSQRRREMLTSKKYKLHKARHWSSYYKAAKKLGALNGELLFWGYRNGTIKRRVVIDWMSHKIKPGNHFFMFYKSVIRTLNKVPVVIKTRQERI